MIMMGDKDCYGISLFLCYEQNTFSHGNVKKKSSVGSWLCRPDNSRLWWHLVNAFLLHRIMVKGPVETDK